MMSEACFCSTPIDFLLGHKDTVEFIPISNRSGWYQELATFVSSKIEINKGEGFFYLVYSENEAVVESSEMSD
jgi:hypothetical protein